MMMMMKWKQCGRVKNPKIKCMLSCVYDFWKLGNQELKLRAQACWHVELGVHSTEKSLMQSRRNKHWILRWTSQRWFPLELFQRLCLVYKMELSGTLLHAAFMTCSQLALLSSVQAALPICASSIVWFGRNHWIVQMVNCQLCSTASIQKLTTAAPLSRRLGPSRGETQKRVSEEPPLPLQC